MARPHSAAPDPREACLHTLLAATEALCASLAAGGTPGEWLGCLERREGAFDALVRAAANAAETGQALSLQGRDLLARIAELDARLIGDGREGLARLQRERLELGRRRKAVQAHGLHERSPARAVTVKA